MTGFAIRPHVQFLRVGEVVRCTGPFTDVVSEGPDEEAAWRDFSAAFLLSVRESAEARDRVAAFMASLATNAPARSADAT